MKDQVLLWIDHLCAEQWSICNYFNRSFSTSKCSLLVMVRMLVKSEATGKLGKVFICSLVAVHELEYFLL